MVGPATCVWPRPAGLVSTPLTATEGPGPRGMEPSLQNKANGRPVRLGTGLPRRQPAPPLPLPLGHMFRTPVSSYLMLWH